MVSVATPLFCVSFVLQFLFRLQALVPNKIGTKSVLCHSALLKSFPVFRSGE